MRAILEATCRLYGEERPWLSAISAERSWWMTVSDSARNAVHPRTHPRARRCHPHPITQRTSRKAMTQIEGCSVVRFKPKDFVWEGCWDDAIARPPLARKGARCLEDWIIAYSNCPEGTGKRIDPAPFLEGYEPFEGPGSYAVSTWLAGENWDENAWFDRPLPQDVRMLD